MTVRAKHVLETLIDVGFLVSAEVAEHLAKFLSDKGTAWKAVWNVLRQEIRMGRIELAFIRTHETDLVLRMKADGK